jgi:hypothetical protein
VLEGADGRNLNGLWQKAGSNELQAIALRQVDVPLITFFTDGRHVETCLGESVVDFVADFETIEVDAWTDLCHEVLGQGAIVLCHGLDSFLDNAADGASPSCVDGADGVFLLVVEQHGNAVGGRHADAHAREVRRQGINTL